jgi:CubicO group peptidase (beta-lactamase class C family)
MTDHGSAIRELLQKAVNAGAAPAAVAQWGRAGSQFSHEEIGVLSIIHRRLETSVESWFDLASLTKPLVTTTLTVLAIRAGSLTPSTKVGEVLPEVKESDVGRLAVDRLLTHTAGLPSWLPLYCLAEGDQNLLVSRLGEVRIEASPGERVVYSCVGSVILGLMLSRTADQPLDGLFAREVLKPLGLENELGYKPDPATHSLSNGSQKPSVETRLVNQLGLDTSMIPPVGRTLPDAGNARFLDGVAGNAGLFGSARGIATLASEYLPGGGELLSESEAAEATKLGTEGLDEARAWGWQLGSTPGCSAGESLSGQSFGHTGFTGVSVWCDPLSRGVFVLLTNRNHPSQRENDLHPLRRRFHDLATQTLKS